MSTNIIIKKLFIGSVKLRSKKILMHSIILDCVIMKDMGLVLIWRELNIGGRNLRHN